METIDLTSYYPGYEDFEERKSKVPFEDYLELEEKLEVYEKSSEELEEVIFDTEQYSESEKIELCKAILKDMKKEL